MKQSTLNSSLDGKSVSSSGMTYPKKEITIVKSLDNTIAINQSYACILSYISTSKLKL